jgi:arginyl-tRNA synthetase
MAVVLKAIGQFMPEVAQATTHLTHGLIKLAGGVKMSSRKGNFLRAVDVLDAAAEANKALNNTDDPNVVLGATKYAFLRQRIGPDIIYEPEESVSLQGNSGPYLQYAHARARSILKKVSDEAEAGKSPMAGDLEADEAAARHLQEGERSLARKLSEYPEVIDLAIAELMPHHICTYLYELAQVFNRFYEHNRVIGDDREAIRLLLVIAYAETLKHGLGLLNIPAPDHM